MWDKNPHVHRKLKLASPYMRGEDVRQLQYGINRHLRRRKLPWLQLATDGVLGRKTIRRARLVAFAMGLSNQQLVRLDPKNGGFVVKHAQRHLRSSIPRQAVHKQRDRRRRRRVAAIRRRHNDAARKTVEWALNQKGITENPPASNRGGKISDWQIEIIGFDGVPWCGCFTGYGSKVVGGVAGISSRVAYTPYTKDDGIAGQHGFGAFVDSDDAKPGDHLMMNFLDGSEPAGRPQHTGFAVRRVQGGWITIEGNTSSGNSGSQDNGGGVFVRTRPDWCIVGASRPNYARV